MYLIYNVTSGEPIRLAFNADERDAHISEGRAWLEVSNPDIGDALIGFTTFATSNYWTINAWNA